MLRFAFIAVDEFSAEIPIDFMEVHAQGSSQEFLREFQILSDLVDVRSLSGIVSGYLNTAAQSDVPFETGHVVRLPALERNRGFFKSCDSLVGIDSYGSVAFLRDCIGMGDQLFFHTVEIKCQEIAAIAVRQFESLLI